MGRLGITLRGDDSVDLSRLGVMPMSVQRS
jgi:hypothetical protein